MRAIKRKKNEVKELNRLKQIVGAAKQDGSSMIQDVIMSDLVVGNFTSLVFMISMATVWECACFFHASADVVVRGIMFPECSCIHACVHPE